SYGRLAAENDSRQALLKYANKFKRRDLSFSSGNRARLQKERPIKRAARAADRRDQSHRNGFENCSQVLVLEFRRLLQNGLKAAVHVRAMIRVTDGSIKLSQKVLLLSNMVGVAVNPG